MAIVVAQVAGPAEDYFAGYPSSLLHGQLLVASAYHGRATCSLKAALRTYALADPWQVLTLFSWWQKYLMNDNAAALRLPRLALLLARQKHLVRGELMVPSALAWSASE